CTPTRPPVVFCGTVVEGMACGAGCVPHAIIDKRPSESARRIGLIVSSASTARAISCALRSTSVRRGDFDFLLEDFLRRLVAILPGPAVGAGGAVVVAVVVGAASAVVVAVATGAVAVVTGATVVAAAVVVAFAPVPGGGASGPPHATIAANEGTRTMGRRVF